MRNEEPEGGWQKADPLHTTEILALTLCKFTGMQMTANPCPLRGVLHADAECILYYFSADAITRGDVPAATELTAPVVRGAGITSGGVEPTFVEPV